MNARRLLVFVAMLNLLAGRASAEQLMSAASRYLVTTTPIKITGISKPLCVGVDPTDAHGVWWWEPGQTGCSGRSTTDVIPAANAAVTLAVGQTETSIRFTVPTLGNRIVDVILTVRDGTMFTSNSDAPDAEPPHVGVRVERRDHLPLP